MHFHFDPPRDFNSDASDAPFEKCLICSEDLLHSGVPYSVEKAKKVLDSGNEVTLYEMAVCMPCSEQMNKRVSPHSRQVMDDFFRKIDMQRLQEELSAADDPEDWKKQCMISRKPKSEIVDYNIVAQMVNGKMLYGMSPMLIDLNVMEPLQELLSAETKEEFDNFRDEFLSPDDPELRALLSDTKFVFF
jgi:hypothetical protein